MLPSTLWFQPAMQDDNHDIRTAKQAVKELQGNNTTQKSQLSHRLPITLIASMPLWSDPDSLFLLPACLPRSADVSSILATYHELCLTILDTLSARLIQSLQLSTAATSHQTLAALLHQRHLSPATLSAALPGSDVSAVWWRLYGKWCDVRELDELLVGMMAGEEDVEQMDEVERRMRALGWEVPATDASSSGTGGSKANDARGAAA